MKDSLIERKKISQVWRSGRMLIGKTQVELAQALNISQSNISKIESMQLVPSASDWYKFCQFCGLDAHRTIELGYIDGCSKFKAKLHISSSFKLPLRYRGDFAMKVREIIPFKECISNELGDGVWELFLKEIHVDPELFFIYDYQVSLNFLLDLMEWCHKKNIKILEKVKKYTALLENHGVLRDDYLKKKSASELLKDLVEKQPYYQRIFKVETSKTDKLLSVKLLIDNEMLNIFGEQKVQSYITHKVNAFQETIKHNTNSLEKFELTPNTLEFSFPIAG